MSEFKLTDSERSTIRKALLGAGIKTRGMNDADLHSADVARETAPIDAVSDLEPPPIIEPKKPKKPTNGDTAPTKPIITVDPITAAINEAIKTVMANNPAQLDKRAIIDLIRKNGTVETIEHHNFTITNKDEKPVTIDGAHPILEKVLAVLSINENCYLVGGAGVGKTHLANDAARALNGNFYATNAVMDQHSLIGYCDAGGVYHDTPFYQALKSAHDNKTVSVFLWDECDASLPAALVYFNMVLEQGEITFPNGEYFKIDKNLVKFICAANTIGHGATREYVGRYKLDNAFLDRFVMLEMNYDKAIEYGMARAAWLSAGGNPDQIHLADQWAKTVIEFRALLNTRRILALCSTRATRRGAGLLALGWALDDVKAVELHKHLTDDHKKQLNVK